MNQIPPYILWIGHAGDGRDYERIAEEGIEALVHLVEEDRPEHPPRGLIYGHFPLVDGIGNRAAWLDLAIVAVANLLRQRVPTLVFGGAGVSRSPVIAAAALAEAFGGPPEECLRQVVRQHRCDVAPGFWDEVKVVLGRRARPRIAP